MTRIIGLTGGIGSGKSTVTNLLGNFDIPIIDTDIIAREVVKPGTDGLNKIIKLFGKSYLKEDGTLNRALLREKIFNDSDAKKTLELILHPLIQNQTLEALSEYKKHKPRYIFVAIPLLIESIDKNITRPGYLDEIWVVDCSVEQQIQRAVKRDGSDRNLIEKIIIQQATRQDRLKHADFVIENRGSVSELQAVLQNKLNLSNKTL